MINVFVVGGGIIGVRTALALAERGYEPTLLEKGTLGGGTTAASIAMFHWPQTDPDQFDHKLREDAWAEYEGLINRGIASFERIGGMYVAESEAYADNLREASTTLAAFGLKVEYLNPEAVTEYGVASDKVTGAMYTPIEGYLDPHELVQHWRTEAETRGATIKTGVKVTDVQTYGEAVTGIETESKRYDAEVVVNATGPWAPQLNDALGIDSPLRHTIGQILVLEGSAPISLPNIIFEDGFYVREEGAKRALAGRIQTNYSDAHLLTPEHARSISTAFKRQVAGKIDQSIPALADARLVNEWTGLRTVTPDGLPLVGSTDIDGWYMACGLTGKGIMYAPVVGDLIADSIDRDFGTGTGQQQTDRLAALDPNRFDTS